MSSRKNQSFKRLLTLCREIMITRAKVFIVQKETIHGQLKNMLILSQCFGLLPVEGVLYDTHERLQFRWRSFKTIYSIAVLTGTLFMTCMSLFTIFTEGYSLPRIGNVFFYSSAAVTVLVFMKLAAEWPELMKTWSSVEKEMQKHYGSPIHLQRKLRAIVLVVMLLATVEHLLSIGSHMMTLYNFHNDSVTGPAYFQLVYPQVFTYINYSVYLAIVVQVISFLSTFMWTYSNLLIIVLSTAMAERFKQITKLLLAFQKIQFQGIKWQQIRQDYDCLSRLCATLDSSLSYLVLLCFTVNLLFILIQLCYSLRIVPDTVSKLYFTFSFGFLILRTVAVSLFAAQIYDESKGPADVLQSVPSSLYNIEVQRFSLQVNFYNVALTGCKLFRITRGLILKIAGAIVTYELVLMQFDAIKAQN